MRRWAMATTLLMAVGMVATAFPVTATASPPAKVAADSTWTLHLTGSGCESDSFASHHIFGAATSADHGTYKGKKKLTMSWTAGPAAGGRFTGTWSRTTGDYAGSYTGGGQTLAATLVPGSTTAQCVALGSATPVVTSAPATSFISFGSSETDTAKVAGQNGVTPTGGVHFYVCAKGTAPCTLTGATTAGTDLGSADLTGSVGTATATSVTFTPPAVGDYCFLAVYSGDDTYSSAPDSSTTDECFSAGSDMTTVTTHPTNTTITFGSSVSDVATVTGGNNIAPTGTVTFYVCGPEPAPAACAATAGTTVGTAVTLSATSNADASSATSAAYDPPATGTYCFVGLYSGDSRYDGGFDSSTTDECFTVEPATP